MAAFNKSLHSKIYAYFIQRLNCRKYRRGWLKGNCPSCGAQDKFGVNMGQNRTNCFKCGFNKKPLNVISFIEGHNTYEETRNFLGLFEGLEYYEPPVEVLKQKRVELPESYKLISLGDSTFSHICRNYLRKRGFSISKLEMAGIGYCTSGDYALRIIIPYYISGKLVYYNARKVVDDDTVKFKNPTLDEVGIGKSLLIYNRDCLYTYKRVYLVESATNALTIGDTAFGIGGKTLSDYQFGEIVKSPCEEVVIILDPDAWDWAIKAAMKLIWHKRVKLVRLEDETDVNNIGRKKTMRYVKSSKWVTYNDLLKLRNDL